MAVGVLLIALLSTAAFVTRDSGTKTVVTPSTLPESTTTTPPLPSAKGKPCVAPVDDLPVGAPVVPVPVGPAPTELVKQDLVEGTGAEVTPGSTITAKYIGISCSTGKTFDASTFASGQPAKFPLTNVIPGWQVGIPGMKVGGQRLLGIPPNLGYGADGTPDIAPDETLWFVIEVVSLV